MKYFLFMFLTLLVILSVTARNSSNQTPSVNVNNRPALANTLHQTQTSSTLRNPSANTNNNKQETKPLTKRQRKEQKRAKKLARKKIKKALKHLAKYSKLVKKQEAKTIKAIFCNNVDSPLRGPGGIQRNVGGKAGVRKLNTLVGGKAGVRKLNTINPLVGGQAGVRRASAAIVGGQAGVRRAIVGGQAGVQRAIVGGQAGVQHAAQLVAGEEGPEN